MNRCVRIAALLIIGIAGGYQAAGNSFEGLAGVDIANAIRRYYAPGKSVSAPSALPKWFDEGDVVSELAPTSWWGSDAPVDYYNYVGGSYDFKYYRSDYPPGEVKTVLNSGDGWTVGIDSIAGAATNVWEPAKDRRGDLARRLMYMVVMYPRNLWKGRGIMIFAEDSTKMLTAYGKRLLLEWHRADPVSDLERSECEIVSQVQGNINPFVELPELAEYLWGMHAGEGFISPENRDQLPLKAVYSKAEDEYIDLYSPYVALNSQWTLDGEPVRAKRIATSELSLGTHELKFVNTSAQGGLKITVKP